MYKIEKQKQALLQTQVMIGTVKETSVVMSIFAIYLAPFDYPRVHIIFLTAKLRSECFVKFLSKSSTVIISGSKLILFL